MPRQCEWIQRLKGIEADLAAEPDTLLDRAAIQRIFQVSRRHASRLLQQFGAPLVGGALVISSRELAARIADRNREEGVVLERQRRHRLEQKLAEAGREQRARQVVIAPAPQPPVSLRQLPRQIRLAPGELQVRFETPVELLQHLLLLAEAISEDWVQFESQAGA